MAKGGMYVLNHILVSTVSHQQLEVNVLLC